MNACSNFVPNQWKQEKCQNCFQLKETHLVTSLPIPIPTSATVAETKLKPKSRRTPTVTEPRTSVPIQIETSTSVPIQVETSTSVPIQIETSISVPAQIETPIKISAPTPTSTANVETELKPKSRRTPTVTEPSTSVPIKIETPLTTSAPAPLEKPIDPSKNVDKSIEECTQRLTTISTTSNDNKSKISLATIIGVEIDEIPDLKKLEALLTTISEESSNQILLQCNVEALISVTADLCKNSYNILKGIELERREMFVKSIIDKIRPVQKLLQENLKPEKWKQLKTQINLLKELCTFNFDEKPLMFARQAVKYILDLRQLENELIGLINIMRQQYPIILNDVLHAEYTRMKKNHRAKIVISCLGSIKAAKSSLINFLLEYKVCPTGNQETTARLTKITYGEQILLRGTSPDLRQPRIFKTTKELLQEAKKIISLKDENN